jgi:hypothetical protein
MGAKWLRRPASDSWRNTGDLRRDAAATFGCMQGRRGQPAMSQSNGSARIVRCLCRACDGRLND